LRRAFEVDGATVTAAGPDRKGQLSVSDMQKVLPDVPS
jgi:hypothetical protein